MAWRNPAKFLGTYTWATRPSASTVPIGSTIRASNVGISPGMMLVSDGTRWIPDGVQVLAIGNTALTVPADTTEDVLATISVPAGLLGVNGGLRVYTIWTFTNSANTKTLRVRFSGAAGTAFLDVAQTTVASVTNTTHIRNRNSASSQIGTPNTTSGVGGSTVGITTSAADTTAATSVVIAGMKASAGETLTLEGYLVEILP